MGDSQRHPLVGERAAAVTGEAVVVRRPPDMAGLRHELQRVLDAGACEVSHAVHAVHVVLCCAVLCCAVLEYNRSVRVHRGWRASLASLRSVRRIVSVIPSHTSAPFPSPSPGIVSVAVVLKHAAIFPRHEQLVGRLAREMGFKQVGRAGLASGWAAD
mgnify:CR=1 FL=1